MMDKRTGPSNGAADGSSAGAPASEPPRKRQRLVAAEPQLPEWANESIFANCLERQIFPHVNNAIGQVPGPVSNKGALGRKEYRTPTPKESPVPLPRPPLLSPRSTVASSSAATPQRYPAPARRLSTTPIPLPAVAAGPSNRTSALRNSATIGRVEEPTAIKDDEELEIQLTKNTVATSTVIQRASASRVPVQTKKTEFSATDVARELWDASQDNVSGTQTTSRWFGSHSHPYLSEKERRLTLNGAGRFFPRENYVSGLPAIVHVDFSPGEIEHLRDAVRNAVRDIGGEDSEHYRDATKDLRRIWQKNKQHREKLLREVGKLFSRRSQNDIISFFQDLSQRRTASKPQLLTLKADDTDQQRKFARDARVQSLLFRREILGPRGLRSPRRMVNFNNAVKVCREDGFELRAEWTDCAGDIITIAWASNDAFICGTTEHSDAHNQQYNKPGNLVLGSCRTGKAKAYPEHRIIRPIVEKGENSTDAMRQTQDPWLYSSVVASDYDAAQGLAFTSGFDRTVKVWQVPAGSSMRMVGEWVHGGNVNFAAASKDGAGMVATASDVAAEAVRIYRVDPTNISRSPYRSFSCSRVTDAEGNTVSTEKWAYFPATIQWGRAGGAEHLLLVGYSPRSRTGDDGDIPEDRLHSGELCLWDGRTGERWKVTAATTQNVFEVMWHPSQKCFIAATSPLGLDVESGVRTQIRIFAPSNKDEYGDKAFSPIKTLDCRAADINELTIVPNSCSYCYVTAGCTDGNTYVWDTAQGDRPVHVLNHGESVEELLGNREREDVGVKFTAWGTTLDRFYTGSSDGVVKVWNVRSLGNPLVQNLMEAPAPISCGMFSPDKTRLLIGDASGRIFLLAVDDQDIQKPNFQAFPLPGGGTKTVRQPTPITRHPEPPPPPFDAEGRPIEVDTGRSGSSFLRNSQIRLHPNPTIGAVQGPRYSETGLFLKEAHVNEDPTQPLYAVWEAKQRESNNVVGTKLPAKPQRQLAVYDPLGPIHARNLALDLDISSLSLETRLELEYEDAELGPIEDYGFVYEDTDDE